MTKVYKVSVYYLLSCELSAVWTSRLLFTATSSFFNLSTVSLSSAFCSRCCTVISVEATAIHNVTDFLSNLLRICSNVSRS